MSDIVEQLRSKGAIHRAERKYSFMEYQTPEQKMMLEAADEIERLQAVVDAARVIAVENFNTVGSKNAVLAKILRALDGDL